MDNNITYVPSVTRSEAHSYLVGVGVRLDLVAELEDTAIARLYRKMRHSTDHPLTAYGRFLHDYPLETKVLRKGVRTMATDAIQWATTTSYDTELDLVRAVYQVVETNWPLLDPDSVDYRVGDFMTGVKGEQEAARVGAVFRAAISNDRIPALVRLLKELDISFMGDGKFVMFAPHLPPTLAEEMVQWIEQGVPVEWAVSHIEGAYK